jgi:hypothetical protein
MGVELEVELKNAGKVLCRGRIENAGYLVGLWGRQIPLTQMTLLLPTLVLDAPLSSPLLLLQDCGVVAPPCAVLP